MQSANGHGTGLANGHGTVFANDHGTVLLNGHDNVFANGRRTGFANCRDTELSNGHDTALPKGHNTGLAKLHCAACGWTKGLQCNDMQSRRLIFDHVFEHVSPIDDKNLPLFRCLLCPINLRLLADHMINFHGLKISQLTENKNYCIFSNNFLP